MPLGVDVVTLAWTSFSPACSNLRSGDKVRVYGAIQRRGDVRANVVETDLDHRANKP